MTLKLDKIPTHLLSGGQRNKQSAVETPDLKKRNPGAEPSLRRVRLLDLFSLFFQIACTTRVISDSSLEPRSTQSMREDGRMVRSEDHWNHWTKKTG